MSHYIIDFGFFSVAADSQWHEDCSEYSEVCDSCGRKRKCHCLVSDEHHTIMDICRGCLKAHGRVVE